MTVRLVGTCPVCERQQKVTPGGAMVHHGFQRPGVGHIIGDCFGVGYPAYELSVKGCRAYREWLSELKQGQSDYLTRLTDRPETITRESFNGKLKTYRRDSEDREERHQYETTLQSKIRDVEYTIKDIDRSDMRMIERIRTWQPAPLVEIDEDGLTPAKREERVARKTERDTKRAEKDQKRQEHLAKVNDRMARKTTQLLFFFDEFDRLAALPPNAARDAYARDLIFEMSKKKYNIRYPQDLWMGPDDGTGGHVAGPWGDNTIAHASRALVALGVGTENQHHRLYWAEPIPVFRSSGNRIHVPEPDRPAKEILEAIASRSPPEA